MENLYRKKTYTTKKSLFIKRVLQLLFSNAYANFILEYSVNKFIKKQSFMAQITMNFFKSKQNFYFLFLLFLAIWSAFFKIFNYQWFFVPLGYDPGIYRGIHLAYVNLMSNFDLANLATRIRHEPFWWVFSIITSKIWISIDVLISYIAWAFSVLWGFCIYMVSKKHNKSFAILAMILFRFSIVQYHSFELLYYKQIIWIDFILLIIYLWQKKSYLLSFPLLLWLIVLHRNSSIYLAWTTSLYLLFQIIYHKKIERKLIVLWILTGSIAMIFYGPLIPRLILKFLEPLVSTSWWSWIQGVFWWLKDFLRFNMFLIPLSIWGLYIKIKKKQFDFIFRWYIFWLIRASIGLLNYKRTLIFRDIFIILMSIPALERLFFQKKIRLASILNVVLFLQFLYLVGYVRENHIWYLDYWQLESIKNLADTTPSSAVIVTSDSYFTPWILWYSERSWLSPWLSDLNTRDHSDRRKWRDNKWDIKCEMFQETFWTLNRPMYLRQAKHFRQENLKDGDCFELEQNGEYHMLFRIKID